MATAIAGYTSLPEAVVRFQAGYLQSIAKIWNNEEPFKESILCAGKVHPNIGITLDNSEDYQTKNLLTNKAFIDLLPGKVPDLGWSAHVYLVEDTKNGPLWSPDTSAGWIGFYDTFEILLPPAPPKEERTKALSAYFSLFPTLLGRDLEAVAPRLESSFDGSDPSLVNFTSILMQAISFSWSEEMTARIGRGDDMNFREALVDPRGGVAVLEDFFGFNNPWNFHFRFKKAEDQPSTSGFKWDPAQGRWLDEDKMHNNILIALPNRPTKGGYYTRTGTEMDQSNVETHALSVYQASGAHYPFTCP